MAELILVKFKHETANKTKKNKKKKTKEKLKQLLLLQKKQRGGFLNCYDFAYADRDIINQAAKVAPGVIKDASNEINNIHNRG